MKKQKNKQVVSYTAEELKTMKDRTDYHYLDTLDDADIDYSDSPETDEAFWADAKFVDNGVKKPISIRVDEEVLDWYKDQGGRYQRLINQVLRQYMQTHRGKKRSIDLA